MTRLRKIAACSRAEWIILLEAAALAVPVALGLRWPGFDRLVAWIGRPRRPMRDAASIDVYRAARLVEAVSRLYPFKATCLKKSLVLWWILRRRGVPAELRIGVRKIDGRFESHAWIECAGRALIDGDLAHGFAPMPLKI